VKVTVIIPIPFESIFYRPRDEMTKLSTIKTFQSLPSIINCGS
jgi:hypothetical protein